MMRSRRRTSELKQNAKLFGGMVVVSAVVGMGVAVSTQGLETIMHRASLALKAMDNPTQLSTAEKVEVKKLIKDKASAKKQFESLSPEQKEQAKQQFNNLSEAEKKKYREMLGK